MDIETRQIDLNDATPHGEHPRVLPALLHPESPPEGAVGHPKNIVMLTADAFGVLPPISSMTPEQAMYHFLSGYTAKVAGTERGVDGAAGHVQHLFRRAVYGARPFRLREAPRGEDRRARRQGLAGQYGVDRRSVWHGAPDRDRSHKGDAPRCAFRKAGRCRDAGGSGLRMRVPGNCPGVPTEVLDPRSTWKDRAAYDRTARKLAGMFYENFAQYADQVTSEVLAAGFRNPG